MTQQEIDERLVEDINKQGLIIDTMSGRLIDLSLTNLAWTKINGIVVGNSIPKCDSRYKIIIDREMKVNGYFVDSIFMQILLAVTGLNYKKLKNEIGFYMTGYEQDDGLIFIDNIILSKNNLNSRKTLCNEEQVDSIVAELLNKGYKNPIIIAGHTHPDQEIENKFQNSWSVQDLHSAFAMSERYKDEKLQTLEILITPSLDTNILFYDRKKKMYYRFQDGVYTYDKHKHKYVAQSAYSGDNKSACVVNLNEIDEELMR